MTTPDVTGVPAGLYKRYIGDPALCAKYLGQALGLMKKLRIRVGPLGSGAQAYTLPEAKIIAKAFGAISIIEIDAGCGPVAAPAPLKGIICTPFNDDLPNGFIDPADNNGGAVALSYPKPYFYDKAANVYNIPAQGYYKSYKADTCGNQKPWYKTLVCGPQHWTDGNGQYLSFGGSSLRYFGQWYDYNYKQGDSAAITPQGILSDFTIPAQNLTVYGDGTTSAQHFLSWNQKPNKLIVTNLCYDGRSVMYHGETLNASGAAFIADGRIIFATRSGSFGDNNAIETFYIATLDRKTSNMTAAFVIGTISYTVGASALDDLIVALNNYVSANNESDAEIDRTINRQIASNCLASGFDTFMAGVWAFSASGLRAVALRPYIDTVCKFLIDFTVSDDGSVSMEYTSETVGSVQFSDSTSSESSSSGDNSGAANTSYSSSDSTSESSNFVFSIPIYDFLGNELIETSIGIAKTLQSNIQNSLTTSNTQTSDTNYDPSANPVQDHTYTTQNVTYHYSANGANSLVKSTEINILGDKIKGSTNNQSSGTDIIDTAGSITYYYDNPPLTELNGLPNSSPYTYKYNYSNGGESGSSPTNNSEESINTCIILALDFRYKMKLSSGGSNKYTFSGSSTISSTPVSLPSGQYAYDPYVYGGTPGIPQGYIATPTGTSSTSFTSHTRFDFVSDLLELHAPDNSTTSNGVNTEAQGSGGGHGQGLLNPTDTKFLFGFAGANCCSGGILYFVEAPGYVMACPLGAVVDVPVLISTNGYADWTSDKPRLRGTTFAKTIEEITGLQETTGSIGTWVGPAGVI